MQIFFADEDLLKHTPKYLITLEQVLTPYFWVQPILELILLWIISCVIVICVGFSLITGEIDTGELECAKRPFLNAFSSGKMYPCIPGG